MRLSRNVSLQDLTVFVGGLAGCGKTLFTPIVGSLERVEIQRYDFPLEFACALHRLGKLDQETATYLLRMYVDLDGYYMAQSREVNFRPGDLSSVFQNPRTFRYLKRLFQKGDAEAAKRMKSEKPILQLTTHNLLSNGTALLKALEDRVRILEIVRHPLYMLKQWFLYIDQYGNDARNLTVWIDHQGQSLPFFSLGWEEKYLASNNMDRCIFSIERLTQWAEEVMESATSEERERILIVPFEPFVLNPSPWVKRIEALLGTTAERATLRELKRQRVPRNRVADGINKAIYRKYGWKPASLGKTERDELKERREFALSHASPEGMRTLDQLSARYESLYLSGLNEFQ